MAHKLLNKYIISRLNSTNIDTAEIMGMSAKILVRFYVPNTEEYWLVTGADKYGHSGDWLFYGYHYDPESGTSCGMWLLSELKKLGIDRDIGIPSSARMEDIV